MSDDKPDVLVYLRGSPQPYQQEAADLIEQLRATNKQLKDWVHTIRYCAIACNNDGIQKVVSEIMDYYWTAEGEEPKE
jgi:hypothetical protein